LRRAAADVELQMTRTSPRARNRDQPALVFTSANGQVALDVRPGRPMS